MNNGNKNAKTAGGKAGKTGRSGLLQNRAYLALLGAQLVSNLGDWLHLLALLTMVGLKWNATPWQITMVSLSMVLPMLLGGPLGGLLADRVERKRLMIVSDLVRVGIVLGLVFVTQIWQVYVLLVAKGIFDVMFSPAKNGKIKEIVPPEQMEQAVSYSAIIEQGSKIIGPALGGMLTAAFGVAVCFVFDGATFLVSAAILCAVPGKPARAGAPDNTRQTVSEKGEGKAGFWREALAGMRIIAGIPLIAFGTLALCMVLLVLQIADSQAVVLFREIPGVSDDLLGWCIALSGGGTLVAAAMNQLLGRWSPLIRMGAGAALLGCVFALAGFAVLFSPSGQWVSAVVLPLFFAAGLGAGMAFIPFQITLQQRTPEAFTGRVFGTVNSLTSAAAVAGPLGGGVLVTAFGPEPAFILSGGLVALIGLLLLLFSPAILHRDRSQGEVALGA